MLNRTENGVIIPTSLPINIPKKSQCLAGQGSVSWFHISKKDNEINYSISISSQEGEVEFE
tara:strand:- start:45 stop:227 length:183 start_codon:yes stop_codon:yes gene_type:complete